MSIEELDDFNVEVSKKNIEFLKKEYGIGGGTHFYPDGTQGGAWFSGKGIAIEKHGSYTEPDVLLPWSKVEKRLRELIVKNKCYLNPKEEEHYADYLEKVEAPQYEIESQRKITMLFPIHRTADITIRRKLRNSLTMTPKPCLLRQESTSVSLRC